MNYDEWKTALLAKHQGSGVSLEYYYWPENDNFKKITKPFFKDNNGDVYSCKKMLLKSAEEVENFIENSENLAVIDIVHQGKGSYIIRFIDLNQQSLTPITVEDFYELYNEKSGPLVDTIEDVRKKIDDVVDLGPIYVVKKREGQLTMKRALTDGKYLYV